MTEQQSKAELLAMRRALYTHFDALIAGLSEQQLHMPGVNGDWSVKDHLAHLTFWERLNLLEMLKAIEQGTSWTDPGLDRSLADVLSEFQATHQQVMESLEKLSEEELQTPYEWLEGETIMTRLSDPNGHYQEHEQYIRDWLARQSSAKE
ncbi:MAG TPA: ClbS/DfsB family four-helix bundle protein [Ktedonobacteraceae bacterium]|nr:ClbS/DfsB family four-helix bundle protein [Ktedonobacteraceae bacterium]